MFHVKHMSALLSYVSRETLSRSGTNSVPPGADGFWPRIVSRVRRCAARRSPNCCAVSGVQSRNPPPLAMPSRPSRPGLRDRARAGAPRTQDGNRRIAARLENLGRLTVGAPFGDAPPSGHPGSDPVTRPMFHVRPGSGMGPVLCLRGARRNRFMVSPRLRATAGHSDASGRERMPPGSNPARRRGGTSPPASRHRCARSCL